MQCFLSLISLHSLEACRIFFGLINISKNINYQNISRKIITIITHKTWVLRSNNLRSMKNLGGKWPRRAKVDLIQPWKNLLFVCQFHPNFQDSSEHDWKMILLSLEGVTSLISLPHPFFQQLCLGMQQAHTAFYQLSASTASRLSRIFSGWLTFQKKSISNTFQYKNIFIINNKIWILR